jgi:hypothetical protein
MLFTVGARRYSKVLQHIKKCDTVSSKTNTVNQKNINRIPTRFKLATGNYMLQTMRAAYNQNPIDPTCKLCNQAEETVSHCILYINCLHSGSMLVQIFASKLLFTA